MIFGFSIWFLLSCLLGVAILVGLGYLFYYYSKVSQVQKARKERQAPRYQKSNTSTTGSLPAVQDTPKEDNQDEGVFAGADVFKNAGLPEFTREEPQQLPVEEKEHSLSPSLWEPVKAKSDNPFGEGPENPFGSVHSPLYDAQAFGDDSDEDDILIERSSNAVSASPTSGFPERLSREQHETPVYDTDAPIPPMPKEAPSPQESLWNAISNPSDEWESSSSSEAWTVPEENLPKRPASPYPSRRSMRNK